MARRYVSIKEVAARAGVSFQTASKVLNGGNVRVSAETAARIIAVAESLGYRPNTVARSLVQRSTATIGLVAGDITDGALSQFAVAAERTARGHGHAVLVGNLAEGGEDGAAVVQMLIDRRVDGVIAAAPAARGRTSRWPRCSAGTCPRSACTTCPAAGSRWSGRTTARAPAARPST